MMRDLIDLVELGNDKQSGLLITGDVGVNHNCVRTVSEAEAVSFAGPDTGAADLGIAAATDNSQKFLILTLCGMAFLILVCVFLIYCTGRKIAKDVLRHRYDYKSYDSNALFTARANAVERGATFVVPPQVYGPRGYGANLELVNKRIEWNSADANRMLNLSECIGACGAIEEIMNSKSNVGELSRYYQTLTLIYRDTGVVCTDEEKWWKMVGEQESLIKSMGDDVAYFVGQSQNTFNNPGMVSKWLRCIKSVRKFLDAVYVKNIGEIRFVDTWKIIGNFIVDAQGSRAVRSRQNDSSLYLDQSNYVSCVPFQSDNYTDQSFYQNSSFFG